MKTCLYSHKDLDFKIPRIFLSNGKNWKQSKYLSTGK